ncbi:MAG: hypothetical protein WDN08_06705 [Rhizomicrobium sp.]
MVGFNLLNPSARRDVLRLTQAHNIGVQDMFAVRRALSDPEGLKEALDAIEKAGQLDRGKLAAADPLGFLKEGTEGIVDAAYRFCRHEPGIDIVLTGTGSVAHLKENVASILRGPLPPATLARLEELFGRVDSVSEIKKGCHGPRMRATQLKSRSVSRIWLRSSSVRLVLGVTWVARIRGP